MSFFYFKQRGAINLIDRIDNYLLSKGKKKRTSHYPSDICSCMRQLYWKWLDEPASNPIEAGALWKMEFGNSIHDTVKDFLKSSGLDIIHEIEFKIDLNLKYQISGRIDSVFVDEDGSLSGIEIKTSFGRGIAEIAKLQEPKEEHIMQVFCYMKGSDLKKFYLIYFGRDNAYRCQFLFEYIDGILCCNGRPVKIKMEDIKNRLQTLEISIDTKTLPDRGGKVYIKNGELRDEIQKDKVKYKSDWFCMYCVFLNKCWEPERLKYLINDNIS